MTDISKVLGKEADSLLQHRCSTITAEQLNLPGADFVDRVMIDNNRSPRVLTAMQNLYNTGRLSGTGYLSILPVDQGVEHSAGASFAANPLYFDPKNIVELALEAGCNCVASTYGGLASVSRRYAHKIPFLVKLNHNETLSYPTQYDQTLYASVDQAFDLGAQAVGATIYFGSEQSRRQIEEISAAFERAHELGMVTVLWAYLRNPAFVKNGVDYHSSADLTGQANHLAATIGADIVKQKMAENNGGYNAVKFGYTDARVYSKLTTDHPIDLVRYQLANCYMGRAGLINSGGAAGENDIQESVRTAVINKRAGGMGLILGRKAFKKSMKDGVALINAVQDVYLDKKVTIA
ncbi:class I fructose-bisphosphate aldolase [Rahnella sp. PCH160]|uniref:class I fructose-bisphosphate aldolase n=1 Tax=Rahnella sp. PCH160 TaxID=3447928 RepID=UPI0039FC86F4